MTLIQFLMFLYRNIPTFNAVCSSQEFLEKLVTVLFPRKRNLAKFQEVQIKNWVCTVTWTSLFTSTCLQLSAVLLSTNKHGHRETDDHRELPLVA